jgi:hypothetical protein
MDQSGQVFYCNFPNLNYSDMKINSIDQAKEFSDSIMIHSYPQIDTGKYVISLIYNMDYDMLVWQICYLEESNETRSDYRCLLINAHYQKLLMEKEMFDITISLD